MYSRKIVGYDLSDSLELKGCVRALNKAIYQAKNIKGLIHHSDRGIQYCVCSQIKMNFFAQNLRAVSANLVKNFDTVFF